MKSPHEQAVEYLRVVKPDRCFWHWSEETQSIVWSEGAAVAMRSEIVEILRRLQPDGLPPFGCIVLLLAALRGRQICFTWHPAMEHREETGRIAFQTRSGPQEFGYDPRFPCEDTEKVTQAVNWLNSLRSELGDGLQTVDDVAELSRQLVAPRHPEPAKFNFDIAALLESGELTDLELHETPYEYGDMEGTLVYDLREIASGLASTNNDLLRFRLVESRSSRLHQSPALVKDFEPGGLSNAGSIASRRMVVPKHQFKLPSSIDWQAAQACEWGFVAAGWQGKPLPAQLALVRASWNGDQQSLHWPDLQTAGQKFLFRIRQLICRASGHPQPERVERILLAWLDRYGLLVHIPGKPTIPEAVFPALDNIFAKPLTVGVAAWLSEDVVQMATDGLGIVLLRPNPPKLEFRNSDGELWCESPVPDLQSVLAEGKTLPILAGQDDKRFLAWGKKLSFDAYRSGFNELVTLPSAITGLAARVSHNRTSLAVCCHSGVSVFRWTTEIAQLPEWQNVPGVKAVFTDNGTLVVVGEGKGAVYRLERNRVRWSLSFDWPNPSPVALLSAGPQHFVTLTADGLVTQFTLQGC